MRVLITGATGLLGNNLVRLLAEQGHRALCLLRQSSNRKSLDEVDCDVVVGDLYDEQFLDSQMDEVDVVVHSAALIHIGRKRLEDSRAVNVAWTKKIARLALSRSIRLVHISTIDTLAHSKGGKLVTETDFEPQKPDCAYVTSKREAEHAVLEFVQQGLDAVVINPGFMLGPFDWQPSSGQMMLALAKAYVPLAPGGGCTAVDVRDVVAGIVSAIESGRTGERYILAGNNMSYFDLWKMMCDIMGRRPPVGKLHPPITWTAGSVGNLVGFFLGKEPQINSAAVKMGQIFHYYSSQKAIDELGYKISPIRPALVDAWNWFQKHGYV